MKRVLIYGMTQNQGGIESFILNYYRNIDREKLQFDFICNYEGTVAYEKDLVELGARVFRVSPRRKKPIRFRKELKELFEQHSKEWCAVWMNVCILGNIDYLVYAKKYNIEKRIIHSHNSGNMGSNHRGELQHVINKRRIQKYATDFWACSESAAKWFYNSSIIKKVKIINNAIDVSRYSFSARKRAGIREKLGADANTYIIGNIGRLHFQKNQMFSLNVFSKYKENNPNSMLVFVGQGDDEESLRKKSVELGIDKDVVFAGVRSDIDAWLSAFDLFLFPSVFEGLSVVALEAQANGVPVLAAEEVSPDILKINGNYHTMSLERQDVEWAQMIKSIKEIEKRESADLIKDGFTSAGFIIEEEAKALENFFTEKGIDSR